MSEPYEELFNLKSERDHLRQQVAELEDTAQKLKAENKLLRQRVNELQQTMKHVGYDPDIVVRNMRDAKRYQWLVKQHWVTWAPIGQAFDGGASGVELDAAIDAAMEADK